MSAYKSLQVLAADIIKHQKILDELETELNDALTKDLELLGKTKRSAAMIASINRKLLHLRRDDFPPNLTIF